MDDDENEELQEMFFKFQSCGAKCAGGLGDLVFEEDLREPGFIVAGLKRALALLHENPTAADRVRVSNVLPAHQLGPFRRELFAVRQEILSLMPRFPWRDEVTRLQSCAATRLK